MPIAEINRTEHDKMAINRQLQIDLRKEQNAYAAQIRTVHTELRKVDPQASVLPMEKAVAGRSLIKKLWDLLPDEQDSYAFDSVEEQTIVGKDLLLLTDHRQTVTLHLGWDVMAFSCTLEAAWQTWQYFAALDTDTFNCCIYPENLEWYIVRAGANLYPMVLSGDGYDLSITQRLSS